MGKVFGTDGARGVANTELTCELAMKIGRATAKKMEEFRLVVWGMHGIYGAGKSLDEAFGLIETAEKAAQIFMLTAHLPRVNTIKPSEMVELADFFGVNYRKDFLEDHLNEEF